jgi:hypothetical protein
VRAQRGAPVLLLSSPDHVRGSSRRQGSPLTSTGARQLPRRPRALAGQYRLVKNLRCFCGFRRG